ncbi:MAG: methionyl-tRNA formyltransferase [Bradymonadia bacterium]|jgi:methionyl-tRNA formyltransferase
MTNATLTDRAPTDLKILFMGTPDFAVATLEAVIALGCQVVGVVSQPARRKGRGRKIEQTPVGACAEKNGLPLFQWPRLNNASFKALSALEPDLCVVVAYGKILPQRYLDLPRFGCFNGHASLLPALRGAAPIQWSVIRGHAEAGATIMQMDAGMDTGDMSLTVRTPIGPDETAGGLHDRLAPMTAAAMTDAITRLCAGTLEFSAQDHTQATMAPMLSKTDGAIDFGQTAQAVHDRVRGMHPWPGAWVQRGDEVWKIKGTRICARPDDAGTVAGALPGTVLEYAEDGPVVACGDGAVVLTVLQRPGKRAQDGGEFMRGNPMPIGTVIR